MHADAITPTEPLSAVAISPNDDGLPPNSGGSASATSLFEACSAFTHVSVCLVVRSPEATFARVLQRIRCLLRRSASGRATDWPDGICTQWRSPTFTAYWVNETKPRPMRPHFFPAARPHRRPDDRDLVPIWQGTHRAGLRILLSRIVTLGKCRGLHRGILGRYWSRLALWALFADKRRQSSALEKIAHAIRWILSTDGIH